MTTINTVEEIIQALDSNPALLEALRSRLLTRETLELPQRLDRFIEATHRFVETTDRRLETTDRRLAALEQGQAELTATLQRFIESTERRLTALEEGQARLEKGQAELTATLQRFIESTDRRLESTERRLTALEEGQARLEEGQAELIATLQRFIESTDRRLESLEKEHSEFHRVQTGMYADMSDIKANQSRMSDDMAIIRGLQAREVAAKRTRFAIAKMGFVRTHVLTPDELIHIIANADTSGISQDDLHSFDEADVIIRATDPQGADSYVPVEVSFTVRTSDITRAARNADYLTRFTGLPARPAVAGIRIHHRAQQIIESGDTLFVGVPERLLRAD